MLWLLLGCAHTLESRFPFKAEPEPTEGHIMVMPFVGTYVEPGLRLDAGFPDRQVSAEREERRRARTLEVRKVPSQVGNALPGQVAAVLGDAWRANFTAGRLPARMRERLVFAIRGGGPDLDEVLSEIGRTTAADGVWVTWVNSIDGAPMTSEADPGEVVVTAGGPVIVDFMDEPYRIEARLGMALVAADGEVVIRYEDDFEAVLTGNRGAGAVGHQLARQLARDVSQFWPTDPRLKDGNVDEPETLSDPPEGTPRRAEVLFRGRPI